MSRQARCQCLVRLVANVSSSSSSSSTLVVTSVSNCSKQAVIDAALAIFEGKTDAVIEIWMRLSQVLNSGGNSEQRLIKYMLQVLKSRVYPDENLLPVAELYSKEQNISDKSMLLIAESYQGLEALNLTRCIKLTNGGLQQILLNCSSLKHLNLYALSTFTDEAYKMISLLYHMRFLDLCGAQNLSDEGLSCIAKCKNLVSLNLTWCVRVTDVGIIAIAQGCTSLEFLSLFGIVGVTDKSLETLSRFCSRTLTTLDVNGCIGIKRRSRNDLLQLFPNLRCFKVHS